MIIWDWLKDKKPTRLSLKHRYEGDVLVVCNNKIQLFYLNKVGGIVFELSNGKNTLASIMNQILKKFDVEESVLIIDLIDLVRDLQFKRIIKLEV